MRLGSQIIFKNQSTVEVHARHLPDVQTDELSLDCHHLLSSRIQVILCMQEHVGKVKLEYLTGTPQLCADQEE